MSKKSLTPVAEPLNSMERFLHAVAVRLDVIIEQNNSIVEYISSTQGVATTSGKVETEVLEEKPKKRSPKKVK